MIALTIQGQVLHDADLRAAIVEDLTARFNTVHVAVSNGQAVAGHPLTPASPDDQDRPG
ncbi:MAG: hypothetical protein ACRD0W_23455 [Acidimicrobiales bacterium]